LGVRTEKREVVGVGEELQEKLSGCCLQESGATPGHTIWEPFSKRSVS